MMIDDINRLPEEIGEHDAGEIRKFRELLRTRKNLRDAVTQHGLDSPQASSHRLALIRKMQEAATEGDGA